MSIIKLKQCPCCGSNAELMHETRDNFITSFVACKNTIGCGLSTRRVPISVEYSSDMEAANMWNRRGEDD